MATAVGGYKNDRIMAPGEDSGHTGVEVEEGTYTTYKETSMSMMMVMVESHKISDVPWVSERNEGATEKDMN